MKNVPVGGSGSETSHPIEIINQPINKSINKSSLQHLYEIGVFLNFFEKFPLFCICHYWGDFSPNIMM
jgi:hypothetical protein